MSSSPTYSYAVVTAHAYYVTPLLSIVEMAEGGGDLLSLSVQKLDEELTCPVCQEHFKEPKVLPCLHYYCKKCVADLISRAKGKPFSCPECRREVQATNNDPER